MPEKETHLGDGVYARWDGHGIILDLRGQEQWLEESGGRPHICKIYLEPEVFNSLVDFAKVHGDAKRAEIEKKKQKSVESKNPSEV